MHSVKWKPNVGEILTVDDQNIAQPVYHNGRMTKTQHHEEIMTKTQHPSITTEETSLSIDHPQFLGGQQ